MDAKTIVVSVVSIAIACLFAVTLLIPVIADSTAETDTLKNEGYYRMTHYESSDAGTIAVSWTYEHPNILTINGEDMQITGPYNMGISVLIDTALILRAWVDNAGNVTSMTYVISNNGYTATVANNDTLSISFSNGSYSGTFAGNSVSGTYNDLYLPDVNGSLIMKDANKTAYMKSDSEILAYGMTTVTNSQQQPLVKGIEVDGNIEDGVTVSVWRGSSGFSTSDLEIHYTENTDYVDLYNLDKITFTGTLTETVDDETITSDTLITYSYFLVPYEVTAERSIHPDAMTSTLLNIIPLFVVIGIILGTVGFIALRK